MRDRSRKTLFTMICVLLLAISASRVTGLGNPAAADEAKVEEAKKLAASWIDSNRQMLIDINDDLWRSAELSFEEFKTTEIMVNVLKKHGFSVQTGLAGMPTAFVASYGSGEPVIGILAELDAMPGLSQDAVAFQKAIVKNGVGHGCQHNLVAASSIATALGLKRAIDQLKLPGTVKVFGPPAEEVFFGKVYMLKAGLFKDVDVALSWHSDTVTNVRYNASTAVDTIRVRFHQKGRQHPLRDLKQFEANIDFLRSVLPSEHSISEAAIIKGGGRPGLNPDMVEAWYSLRTFDRESVEALFGRVKAIAEFQANILGGQAEIERINGVYPRLPNETLVKIADRNLRRFWPPQFTDEERAFARRLQEEFKKENPNFSAPAALHEDVLDPPIKEPKRAGNDNGDVSWVVPMVAISGGSRGMLLPSHNWQSTAAAGMGIGHKVMILMGQTLAATAIDLLLRPENLSAVREEFRQKTKGFVYKPYVPDTPPVEFYGELNKIFGSHE